MHVISRQGDCGGDLFGVLPIFSYNPLDGSSSHASFRVWPCYGPAFRKAGAEWDYRSHISVLELRSVGRGMFTQKRLTDRLNLFDELEFLRCPFTHCYAGEFQARVAIGKPEKRNGIVYSAIGRVADTHCLAQITGRILRHVFMFLCDYGYIPWDVDMHTVTLHMQFHEGPRHRALKLCFEAWASALLNLPRQRAAAVSSPPVPLRPTRPCP